jgi:hypothetical protein
VLSSLAGLLRLASLAICLVAIASFGLFALDQTSSASARQQSLINGAPPAAATPTGTSLPQSSAEKESSLHRAIDDASNVFTSPFSGVTAGSSSEWIIRGTNLLLVLIVYGFGLAFLARVIRVRA